MKACHFSVLVALSTALDVAAAAKEGLFPDSLNVSLPHFSRDKPVKLDCDIVHVRKPHRGDNARSFWTEIAHPTPMDSGADLMLLPPGGSEELLVAMAFFTAQIKAPAEDRGTSEGKVETKRADKSWWSLQPLRAIKPPSVRALSEAWKKNPIDGFLYAKLAERKLKPSSPADPRALVRRIYFVLTGLPPTQEEVEAFVRECSIGNRESAIANLTERLLASPHFGERFARHWMDVVRYADTHGTEDDAWLPHAWRYRDYLIRAFNEDLPYDQFVREHIAGDLLPKPRWNQALDINESLLATAWWRLVEFNQTPVDVKGEEVIVVDNQIDALSKAFLGLTVSCARCHDHKFDPISQHDFHGLYSILASTRTSVRVLDPPEKLHARDVELVKLKTEIRAALVTIWQRQIALWPRAIAAAREDGEPAKELQSEITRWRAAFAAAETNKQSLSPLLKALRSGARNIGSHDSNSASKQSNASRLVNFADFTTGSDCGWFATGGFTQRAAAGDFSIATTGSNILSATYPAGRYSHLISDKHPGTLRSPNFTITNKFISALVTGDNNARLRLVIENFQGDSLLFTQVTPKLADRTVLRWVTLPIRDNWRGRRAYIELTPRDDFPYPGIVKDVSKLPTDGRSAAGIAKVIFHDGEKLAQPSVLPTELSSAKDVSDLAAEFTDAARHAVDAWAADKCDDAQALFLNSLLRAGLLENEMQTASAPVARHREIEAQVPVPTRVVAVSDEAPGFNENLFPRGNHLQPAAAEPRHFLSAFNVAPYRTTASGRRELAEDILCSPLASRVMVNRLWHHVFGAGLARSVDNFGKLGEQPSHPELLDWLANDFIARGWSVKAMLRLMLTSEAFASSSEVPPGAAERDPDNRLLSHANLRRLDAESLRDAILAASGRLDRAQFGPGVPVLIPAGQRDDYSPNDGPLDGLGRRSLYLEVRRNHPSPFLFAFDQPKPASPAGRRAPTNVPAQSLTLLNDPFVVQQAGLFAQRALAQSSDTTSRIRWFYATALCRPATDAELHRAEEFLVKQTGTCDGSEVKAWCDLAQAMFNLKEFLYLK